jgi:hypothetical protein
MLGLGSRHHRPKWQVVFPALPSRKIRSIKRHQGVPGYNGRMISTEFSQCDCCHIECGGVIGGLHLFPATDEQLAWTADKMKEFKVANLMGAHCTGIEAVYRIRERLALPRASAVVGSVGSSFVLGEGIHPGPLAK